VLVVLVVKDHDYGSENRRDQAKVAYQEAEKESETKHVAELCFKLEVVVRKEAEARVEQSIERAIERVV